MKYSPQIYARALGEIAAKPLKREKRGILVKNFLNLIKKNNDQYLLKKIFREAEKLIREKTGKRKIIIETARSVRKNLISITKKVAGKKDILEYKIDPNLIAGMKITINDELQFDGSLDRKIKKLFS